MMFSRDVEDRGEPIEADKAARTGRVLTLDVCQGSRSMVAWNGSSRKCLESWHRQDASSLARSTLLVPKGPWIRIDRPLTVHSTLLAGLTRSSMTSGRAADHRSCGVTNTPLFFQVRNLF